MVKLRLRRRGRKARPVYDIVASDSRSPRDGRFIERVGQYNPLVAERPVTMLDRDRVLHWLKTGAQPTDTVRSLLSREGIMLEMHMSRKGAEAGDINAAVERHLENRLQRTARKSASKPAPAAAPVAEAPAAPAAEAPAAEAEAPAAETEAPAEAPATETPAENAE